MEKIRSLLNPGAKQDNEVLYGEGNQGQTSANAGNTGTLTGEGSHFESSRNDPSTTTSGYDNSSTTAGPHSSNVANKADPRVDSDLDGSRGLGAHSTTGNSSQQHGNQGAIGSNANAGPHSSGLASKADPRVDSDLDGSRGLGGQSTTGTTGQQYGNPGAIGSNANAGPHSSGLANKADPRVDSDLDGSRGLGTHNAGLGAGTHERFGEDQTGGIGSGTTGPRSNMPGAFSGGYPSTDSTTSIKSGVPGRTAAEPNIGADTNKPLPHRPAHGAGELAAAGTTAGIGAESAHHHHGQQHQVGSSTTPGQHGSGLGTSTGAGVTEPGYSHHAGHHDRKEAALHEGSGLNTGSGATVGATSHQAGHHKDHHTGRDAAVGVGALGAFEAHEHAGHGHKYAGDPCGNETQAATGVPHDVSGPHATHAANLLDPHVGSSHGQREHLASTGTGADVVGGAYEAGQPDPSTSTGPASKTIGQHKSNVLNVLDPRVQPDPEKMKGRHAGGHDPAAVGTGEHNSPYSQSGVDPRVDSTPRSGATTGQDHHYGRDAGLAGAGVAGLEGERHHHDKNAGLDGAGTTTGKDHHYGRDAGLATGAVGAEHEYSKHGEHPGAAGGESKHQMKQLEKQESKHEKAIEKEEKKEHRAAVKEEKREEKEAEKEEKGGKKHGGLLGLFHRDKPDETLKEEEAARKEREAATATGSPATHHHHGAETTGAGVGTGAAAYEGRNKLHKDPPQGYGTQSEGLAGRDSLGAGNNTTGTSGQVIEPHTGLPVNPDKYGTSGAGGLDAGTAPGVHEHGHGSTGLKKASSPTQTTGGAYSGGY